MSIASNFSSDVVRRGQELYEREIHAKVGTHKGKMLALDVDSGQYALGDDSLSALDRLKAVAPNANPYLLRVGYPTAVNIGGSRKARSA